MVFWMDPPIVIDAHTRHVSALLFTPDNTALLSTGMDNLTQVWAAKEWTQLNTLFGHTQSVNAVAITPNGGYVITGSTDTTVKVWNYPSGDLEYTLSGHKKTVSAVAVDPTGKYLASGSYDGNVKFWDLTSGAEQMSLSHLGRNISSIDFSPDGKLLAAGGLGDDIFLWAVPSGELVKQIKGHETAVTSLAFSPDGQWFASIGYEQRLRIRETQTWNETTSIPLESRASDLAFTSDSKKVAAAIDYGVRIWNLRTNEIHTQHELPVKGVYAVAVSPTRRWLAVGSADGKVRIWALRKTVK